MMQFKYQVKCYHFSIVEIIAERVSSILMPNIIKKLFYSVVQTSSGMLSFLHRQDHCWKCEFNKDFKIEKYIIVMERKNVFVTFVLQWIPIYLTKTVLGVRLHVTEIKSHPEMKWVSSWDKTSRISSRDEI